ncbi:alpha/beta hydrolase fold-domain-containing protein [Annulohypoxylon truncatum]|uniref:alpha/beta hydrolase fold-domain-containing protein n=1 Tax=Annulohypoxylon truncatum TaxID=327061 RepID=UPI002008CEF4|nr:alpha/beta hydrolase fold-domain-containing protein [Annulohypoxylon truncatum]KAI1212594.1 alpha/beta hydrolase fold-domain-containing protein [Annulohypoxylon truncatum]
MTSKMGIVVDPEYAQILAKSSGQSGDNITTDVLAIRAWTNALIEAASKAHPYPEGMRESTHSTTSLDGTILHITRFLPLSVQKEEAEAAAEAAAGAEAGKDGGADKKDKKAKRRPKRAVVFVFGGGMISGTVQASRGFIAAVAENSQTQVFAPQYRIAPEHPYHAGVDDVYATIQWLQRSAADFDVDPKRVIIMGQSAGGGVAAGVALMARDKGLDPPLAGQCLRYPMLDDRTWYPESDPRNKYWTWSVAANDMGWTYYLGGLKKEDRNEETVPCYAVPARAKDLRGLPPTQIGVGSLDLFKDENLDYAARLVKADVGVEFHLYPGMPHGFDGPHGFTGVPAMRLTGEMWEDEARWIMKL